MSRLAEYWKKVSGAQEVIATHTTGSHGITSEDPRRRLESYGLSHVGKVREGNEDHFVIASLQRSLEVRQTNFEQRMLLDPLCGPKAYLFAVADGVGGQDGGKLASGLTIQTIVEYLSETVGSYHAVPAGQEQAFLDPLGHAVQRAQEKLLSTFGLPQGGPSTTLTIALVVWPKAFIVHVGDSRAYRLSGGTLKRLTRDQTMGAFLVDEYKMSEEQVEQGGYNNVLSSAVGSPEMTPAVRELTLERGDILLLCTDGLTKHVSEERIASVLSRSSNPESSCRQLVDLALAGGGRDNVTVVVANTLTA
jgi:PPM family protein phosphatase